MIKKIPQETENKIKVLLEQGARPKAIFEATEISFTTAYKRWVAFKKKHGIINGSEAKEEDNLKDYSELFSVYKDHYNNIDFSNKLLGNAAKIGYQIRTNSFKNFPTGLSLHISNKDEEYQEDFNPESIENTFKLSIDMFLRTFKATYNSDKSLEKLSADKDFKYEYQEEKNKLEITATNGSSLAFLRIYRWLLQGKPPKGEN